MKDLFIEKMYELTKILYQKLFKKNKPCTVNQKILLSYPTDSLGFHLGCFLLKYNFEIQSHFEYHDIIHVLTNTGITVPNEIAMQYYLLGNGKKSVYLYLVIITGTLFYFNQFKYFKNKYDLGKQAVPFYNLSFEKLLMEPIIALKIKYKIK